MVRRDDLGGEAARLDKLYRAKARAEVSAAETLAGRAPGAGSHGDVLAAIVLLKGEPSSGDLAATSLAAAGQDGEAARKALEALGYDPGSTYWAYTRPGPGEPGALAHRVGALLEAVDPRVVIALDAVAAADLGEACGASLEPGKVLSVRGRRLLVLSGLEASLGDEAAKGRVWKEFQALGRPSGTAG